MPTTKDSGIKGTKLEYAFKSDVLFILYLHNNEMTIAQYIEHHRADRNYALQAWFGRN